MIKIQTELFSWCYFADILAYFESTCSQKRFDQILNENFSYEKAAEKCASLKFTTRQICPSVKPPTALPAVASMIAKAKN